jgi:TetR/AcrR family transcriptional regulator, cholesterol catabolism regulator
VGRPRATDIQTIIEAAARVFERHGFTEATLSDVAVEAGISKPTIYQYVRSKQHLLEIIVERLIFPLSDGVDEILSAPSSAREKIEAYLRLHVQSAIRYRVYYQVLATNQQQLSGEGQRRYQSWARKVDRAAATLLERGAAEGIIRPDIDLEVAAHLLNSMLVSIGRWHRTGKGLSQDELYQQVLKFVSGLVTLPAEKV